ncbi:hypothetical protein PSMK_03420 [Phycisphaera mikurensis NBRC 102666]|uniref:Antitoxin n=1 Tax=Phycisphaera mikurensis (strain NBRC 102666 / KCTC 22515 / FYK2301M01) TaxID=1142394 RepID=I0IB63_PHYMF|nr:hypothetical protein PSMK_03420 [Phycisphaera mikurensis NBRC 102666]
MEAPLELDDKLVKDAMEVTGIEQRTALIHYALRDLLAREAALHLSNLGGSMPDIEDVPRRRPPVTRAS